MQINKHTIEGLISIHPSVYGDDRGDFLESFNEKSFKQVESMIKQINSIKSKKIHAIYQTRKDFEENIKKRETDREIRRTLKEK